MKLFNALILIVCFLLSSNLASAELVDRIVAVVNDDVITFSDLNRQGESLFKRIIEQAPPQEVDKALLTARQEMLSRLIDKLIIEQRAGKFGISVSDEEIDGAIERILETNNRSRKDLDRDLKLMGTSEEEFRDSIKNQILHSKLISYEVSSKVVITEEKIKEYYNQHYVANNTANKTTEENSYHILQMGFTWEDEQDKEQAHNQAEAIRKMVLEGGDFMELAKKYSDLPSSADGGNLGICKKDELATYMRASCLILKPGDVSPVIETPAGYQFFKLADDGVAGKNRPYEEVKDEIKNILYDQEVEEQYQNWVTELRDQAYIKKLL